MGLVKVKDLQKVLGTCDPNIPVALSVHGELAFIRKTSVYKMGSTEPTHKGILLSDGRSGSPPISENKQFEILYAIAKVEGI